MNKLSKIFLVIIIVLVLALCIMSYLYVNMRKSSLRFTINKIRRINKCISKNR